MKARLDVYEQRLDLFNLEMIRQRVIVLVEASGVLEKIKEEPKGWFSGWFGGSSDVDTTSGADMGEFTFKLSKTRDLNYFCFKI